MPKPSRISPRVRVLVLILLGIIAVLVLQWHISSAWQTYYSHFPLPGYSKAMESGQIAPFLTTSTRAYQVTGFVLFLLPLVTLPLAQRRPVTAGLYLWCGVIIAIVAIWIATPRLRQDSNMWPIDFIFLAIQAAVPLFAGALVCVFVVSLRGKPQPASENRAQT